MKVRHLCPVIKARKFQMANTPALTARYKRNEARRAIAADDWYGDLAELLTLSEQSAMRYRKKVA